MKADFDLHGISLGYLQLDSWFYPKGTGADWADSSDGIFEYFAAPPLFGAGLASFQQSLGISLITHARWIDVNSPYRQQYKCPATFRRTPATGPTLRAILKPRASRPMNRTGFSTARRPIST